jgi:hypothetical protein
MRRDQPVNEGMSVERYTDGRGRSFPLPTGVMELVLDLEWAVEADCAPDRDRRTELRRAEARDALMRHLAGQRSEVALPLLVRM